MIKVGIFGATGYTGFQLIKFLLNYKNVKIECVTTSSNIGKSYSTIYTSLTDVFDMKLVSSDEGLDFNLDAAFLALPHTESFKYVEKLLSKKVKVIDLSADYRFKDYSLYEKYYKVEHKDRANIANAVYGIPEINPDEIRNTEFISNPGCYPTSTIIPLYPLLKENIISPETIYVDTKSGVSGSGKKPADNIIFCEIAEDFKPYNILEHRHKPEIDEKLFLFTGKKTDIIFVPYLLPIKQGMFTTIYASLTNANCNETRIKDIYLKYYFGCKYIRLRDNIPRINDVVNTNFNDIYFKIKNQSLIIFSAIDNLIKGASGQALQNFNLLFGIDFDLNKNR